MLKTEFRKVVNFFVERDNYKRDLKGWIKKYGFANLPKSVQRTVPTDMKVLYEIKWKYNIVVWTTIFRIAIANAQNEGMRRATNG